MITKVRMGGPSDDLIDLEEAGERKFRYENRRGTEQDKLAKAFERFQSGEYSVTSETGKSWAQLYSRIEGIEYLNMEYLAAAIILLERAGRPYDSRVITPAIFQKHKDGVLARVRSGPERDETLLRYLRNLILFRYPEKFETTFMIKNDQ